MQIIYTKGDKKKCAVCCKRTANAREYGYKDGISIRIPVCENCKNDVGLCLSQSMNGHLKAISNEVLMSRIITNDERRLKELYQKERENQVSLSHKS